MRNRLENLKAEVLALIARRDNQLTWFGIARTIVDEEFLPVIDKLGEILRECEQQELIARPDGDRYRITEAGQNYLQRKLSRRPQHEAA